MIITSITEAHAESIRYPGVPRGELAITLLWLWA
jgi:hypothetical protein